MTDEAPTEEPDCPQDIILENDAWRIAPFLQNEAEAAVVEALGTALAEAKLPEDAGNHCTKSRCPAQAKGKGWFEPA